MSISGIMSAVLYVVSPILYRYLYNGVGPENDNQNIEVTVHIIRQLNKQDSAHKKFGEQTRQLSSNI